LKPAAAEFALGPFASNTSGGCLMPAVFIGPPGSGKGTQAELLRVRLGIATIGTGDILRDAVAQGSKLGKQVKPYLEAGDLAPDNLVNAVVAELLRRPDQPERLVLDGYPRNAAQAAAFDAVLREQKLRLTAVIHFVIEEDVVIRRMSARKRSDDGEKVIRERLKVYRENSPELVAHYRKQKVLHEVQADADIERLYVTVASILLSAKR
jgi:adenylate kinase